MPYMIEEKSLSHYGVKGMRWGVRKDDRISSSKYYDKDFTQKENVYRIIAKTGSRPLSDITYVSTNDVDNQRYIHILNNTISAQLFKDAKYEKQLVLGPTKPLKAPSIQKAEQEIKKLYDSSSSFKKFVKDNEVYFGKSPTPAKLNQIMNTAFVDDDRIFDGAIQMRQEIKKHFQKLGYNSLIDQNDIREGLAQAPLIVFDPEKTLRVVSQRRIDKVISSVATKTYKETEKNGWT